MTRAQHAQTEAHLCLLGSWLIVHSVLRSLPVLGTVSVETVVTGFI